MDRERERLETGKNDSLIYAEQARAREAAERRQNASNLPAITFTTDVEDGPGPGD